MKRLVKVSPRNVPISKTRPRGVNAVAKLAKCVIYLMDPSRCRDYACINLDAALQRNREGGWLSHAQAGRPSFTWEHARPARGAHLIPFGICADCGVVIC